jgi:O-antigen ligase
VRLLLGLAALGYPTSNVLRFVPGPNETYTSQLRAIGTSVDPNLFGGSLMLALGLLAMQWASRAPLLGRPLLLLLVLPTLSGLLLSLSRASWVGLAAGVLLVGSLRHLRVWLAALLAPGLLVALPLGQGLVERFVGGFTSADPATALRLGEYRNALALVQRYPLLGIGFGASPDIDVTAGVSSVYLLVGEQTGLVGLVAYLAALVATLLAGLKGLRMARQDERLHGVLAGALAAYIAALVAGFADHYFANQAFPHAVALFWLYAALLVAGARQARPAG